MKSSGVEWSEVEGEYAIEAWPENALTIEIFAALRTQWRVGFGGPYGLDYTAVVATMRDRYRVVADVWDEVFDGVRVMESAAVEFMAKQKAKA